MEVAERIRKNKPDISDSSVKTYTSIITNLSKRMGVQPPQLLKSSKKVLDYLKDTPPNRRKGILAAVIVYHGTSGGSVEDLRKVMMDDISAYNAELKDQNKTERDEDNWIEWPSVVSLFKERWKHDSKLLQKGHLTKTEARQLQELVLLAIYTLIPPRRSEDYCQFKLRDVDEEKDNFMDASGFVFNTYKTAKKYGKQTVKIPKRLRDMIEALKRREDWGDYLLRDTRGNKTTPSKLTQYLNGIFGKKVGSSLLRKSFLTHKYRNIPALKDIDQVGNDMGNSLGVQLSNYVKRDENKKEKDGKKG
jgi:hypothetical protein